MDVRLQIRACTLSHTNMHMYAVRIQIGLFRDMFILICTFIAFCKIIKNVCFLYISQNLMQNLEMSRAYQLCANTYTLIDPRL